MNIQDLELEELLDLLPAPEKEELENLIKQFDVPARTGGLEEILKTRQEKLPPSREMLYKLISSKEHGTVALAIFMRIAGAAFAGSSDPQIKATLWTLTLVATGQYFMHHVAKDTTVHSMINQLVGDIENIAEGRSAVILKEKKARGRPVPAKQNDTIFAYSSVIIDKLVLAGMAEQAAAKEVAKFLQARGWPLPLSTKKSNTGSAERLLNWRAQIRSRKGSAFARQMYKQAGSDVVSMSPKDAVARLVLALELTGTKV